MKISGRKSVNQTSGISQSSRVNKPEGPQDNEDQISNNAADVELSDQLQQVEKARQIIEGLTDVRIEKVEEIKPRIEDGSYQVDSQVVAKKIVDASLREDAERKSRGQN